MRYTSYVKRYNGACSVFIARRSSQPFSLPYRGNYYYDLSLRPRKTQGWASENAAGQLNHTEIKMFP